MWQLLLCGGEGAFCRVSVQGDGIWVRPQLFFRLLFAMSSRVADSPQIIPLRKLLLALLETHLQADLLSLLCDPPPPKKDAFNDARWTSLFGALAGTHLPKTLL